MTLGALHSPALAAAGWGRPRLPRRALPPRLGRGVARPALPRASPGPAQRPARGGGRSLQPEPSARPCSRGNACGVGADSGRSVRTARRQGRAGPRRPPERAWGCGLRGGARGLERAPPGWAGRAGAQVAHEGVPSCFQDAGSVGQGQDSSEHWERGVPAAGAQAGRWELLPALPHLHTSHVNSPWAAPPAPRGLSEMKPTAALV